MKKENAQFFIPPAVGILGCILLIVCCARQPLDALISFFVDTFSSAYSVGIFLNTASLLMTAGIGACVALKSGNMNLGGEGQIYLGGFVAATILILPFNIPSWLFFMLALFASLLSGAVMAVFSAILFELRGALVLLTSFLVSAAIIPLIDGAVALSNKTTNLLATPFIPERFRIKLLLPPSQLNITFFIAITICVLAWFFIYQTYAGRKMQVWGTAPLFARYCGYSRPLNTYGSLATSGALHALTGFFAVVGTYYTCHKGFYSGMGWNALSVALIAQSNPLMTIPSALLLAWLYTSADRVSLTQGFSFDVSGIIQGIILFSIAIPFTISKIKTTAHIKAQKDSEATQ